MRTVERLGDLDPDLEEWLGGKRAPFEPRREGLALDQLHHQVAGLPFVSDVEQGADVGVVEAGDGLGFALETGADIRVARQPGRQDLDGDVAPEAGVACAIDLAHSARAQRGKDLVGTKTGAGGERHGRLH
jgi:hypothetical protein